MENSENWKREKIFCEFFKFILNLVKNEEELLNNEYWRQSLEEYSTLPKYVCKNKFKFNIKIVHNN